MIDKKQYIDRYNKEYNKYCDSGKKNYKIDSDYIYCVWLKQELKYKIDDIVKLMNFYYEFKNYIYNLKVNDKILNEKWYRQEEVIIKKINYKRKNKYNLPYKNKISSLTVKSNYEHKLKISDIVYQEVKFEDLLDVCRHFWNYLFFNEYTIKDANKILTKINDKGVIKNVSR